MWHENVLGTIGNTPLVRLSRITGDLGPRDRQPLILAKLEWSEGVSELQLRDCANLLRANADIVDWTYLERYARVLGVDEILARLRAALT
jgi:hypothetical protein